MTENEIIKKSGLSEIKPIVLIFGGAALILLFEYKN